MHEIKQAPTLSGLLVPYRPSIKFSRKGRDPASKASGNPTKNQLQNSQKPCRDSTVLANLSFFACFPMVYNNYFYFVVVFVLSQSLFLSRN